MNDINLGVSNMLIVGITREPNDDDEERSNTRLESLLMDIGQLNDVLIDIVPARVKEVPT